MKICVGAGFEIRLTLVTEHWVPKSWLVVTL